MKRKSRLLTYLFLLFLPSCVYQQTSKVFETKKVEKSDREVGSSLGQEARLIDVPIVIDADILNDYTKTMGNCSSLTYKSSMNYKELILFYIREMERNSWRQLTKASFDFETLLIFEKPYSSKFCSISIRSLSDKVFVYIYLINNM